MKNLKGEQMKNYVYVPRGIRGEFVQRFVEATAGYVVDIATIRQKITTENYENGKIKEKTTEYIVDFPRREEMQTTEDAARVDESLIFNSYKDCKAHVKKMNAYINNQMEEDSYYWSYIDKLNNIVTEQQQLVDESLKSELNL